VILSISDNQTFSEMCTKYIHDGKNYFHQKFPNFHPKVLILFQVQCNQFRHIVQLSSKTDTLRPLILHQFWLMLPILRTCCKIPMPFCMMFHTLDNVLFISYSLQLCIFKILQFSLLYSVQNRMT